MKKRVVALFLSIILILISFSAFGESFADPTIDAQRNYTMMQEYFAECEFEYSIAIYEECELEGYEEADFIYYMAKVFDKLLENRIKAKQGVLDTKDILMNLDFAKKAIKEGDSIAFIDPRDESETDYWGTIEYSLAGLEAYVTARDLEQKGYEEHNQKKAYELFTEAIDKYLESKLFDFLKRLSDIQLIIVPETDRFTIKAASSADAYSVSIQFEDNQHTDDMVYTITYAPANGGREEQTTGNACEFQIDGLIPSTVYSFVIMEGDDKTTVSVQTKDAHSVTGAIQTAGELELQQVAVSDLDRGESSAYRRGKFIQTVMDEETTSYIISVKKRTPTGNYRYYLVAQVKNTDPGIGEYDGMLVLRLEGAGTYSCAEKYTTEGLGSSYATLHYNTDELFEEFYNCAGDDLKDLSIFTGTIEMYINGLLAGDIPITMIRK